MQKPKLNPATLTPEQRDKLELWQQAHDQLQTLNDIANIVQDISTNIDEQKKGDTSEKIGALLMDMRDSLNELKSKADPKTPDFSIPIVKAVANLEKAFSKLNVSPVINVDAPEVNVAPAKVELGGVEKAIKAIPKAFEQAIKLIPKPEKTDNKPLLEAWEGISEQLLSIETATRMKPQGPANVVVSNLPAIGFAENADITTTIVTVGAVKTITSTDGVKTQTTTIDSTDPLDKLITKVWS